MYQPIPRLVSLIRMALLYSAGQNTGIWRRLTSPAKGLPKCRAAELLDQDAAGYHRVIRIFTVNEPLLSATAPISSPVRSCLT